MRALALSLAGVAGVASLPLAAAANADNVEAYGCDPEGWFDAGVVLDLVKPDVGSAGIGLQWASTTPGYQVERKPVVAANEIARLAMTYPQDGQVRTRTYILRTAADGSVELDQDPPTTFKFAKKVNGIPAPWRCGPSKLRSTP